MTIYMGTKTIISIDREKGRLTVYNAKTGELMYQLRLNKCGS